jgi:hypothetical protein
MTKDERCIWYAKDDTDHEEDASQAGNEIAQHRNKPQD